MSPSTLERSKPERRRIRAEAAAWIAKLHGPERTSALEERLRQWLAEDRLHAAEFELATDVWNESGSVPRRRLVIPIIDSAIANPKFALKSILAAAAICVLVVAFYMQIRTPSVTTSIGEQRTLTLPDGSQVTLNADTRIVVAYTNQARAITLEYGQAYFDVIHNTTRPFIVRAADHKIVDLGTQFVVTRNDPVGDSLTVTVVQGQVAVAPLSELDVSPLHSVPDVDIVNAGHRLEIRPNTLPAIDVASAAEATAWLNGHLLFDGTPLSDAAAQFNRYNRVKILVPSTDTARIPVGGVFRIGDSASFARAVAASHDLILTSRGDELILKARSNTTVSKIQDSAKD